MALKKKLCLLFLLMFVCEMAMSQVTPPPAATAKDSAAFYKKIEKYSKKRRFTSFVHGLIFEPLTPKTIKARHKTQTQKYKLFQGKIVRKINIVTLDPFGYSEADSTKTPQQSLANAGNRLHLKTKRLTILNLILIKRNKPLDSLLVKESERLIRAQRYVRRVIITPKAVSTSKDSVDIDIRELDSWSLLPNFSTSGSKTSYQLTERNFLGLGHEVDQSYQKDLSDGHNAYSVKYTIPNIMNTYIRSIINYNINLDHEYTKSINIERPFFSPYARWAAGVYFDQQFKTDSLPNASGQWAMQNFKTNATDLWAGHSNSIFKGSGEDERTTNLITAIRYQKINYKEMPAADYDTINFYSTEHNYLIGVGISSRQFIQDRYIFNYGIIEDVPVGKIIGLTGGMQRKNGLERMYLGGRVSSGKYYKYGYFGTNLEYGTYFNHGTTEQSAVSLQANYFTNLYETGRWKFRQFIKAELVVGNNRQPSWGDMLTLEGKTGIQGFNSTTLYGTRKWLVTSQTQSYAPWNLLGFRLNPYLSYSVGMLGDSVNGFSKGKAYSQIGVGLLISNDFLVFSTFQLSLSFYPTLPDDDKGAFKTNAFSTDDFGLMDFELAKPRTVLYQ